MKNIIKIIALITFVFNVSAVQAQQPDVEQKIQLDEESAYENSQSKIEAQNKIIPDAVNSAVDNKKCEKDCKKACCAKVEAKSMKSCCKNKKSCKKSKADTAATCDSKKKKCKKVCKKKENFS